MTLYAVLNQHVKLVENLPKKTGETSVTVDNYVHKNDYTCTLVKSTPTFILFIFFLSFKNFFGLSGLCLKTISNFYYFDI